MTATAARVVLSRQVAPPAPAAARGALELRFAPALAPISWQVWWRSGTGKQQVICAAREHYAAAVLDLHWALQGMAAPAPEAGR